MCLIYQYINPELPPILYMVEDNKIDSSSNVGANGAVPQYKGLADNLHNQIVEIDQQINKLNPESENYLEEKKALLEVREMYTDHMSMVNQFRSTTANSYIPESSDNKRAGDGSMVASSSKRSRAD